MGLIKFAWTGFCNTTQGQFWGPKLSLKKTILFIGISGKICVVSDHSGKILLVFLTKKVIFYVFFPMSAISTLLKGSFGV